MVSSVWEFDVFDFFSYISPGVVAISLAYPLLPSDVVSRAGTIDDAALLLGLVLGGYIVGHFAQRSSDWLRRTFSVFSYVRTFDEVADSDEKSPVQAAFFEEAPGYLGIALPDVGEDGRNDGLSALYHTSKSYLVTRKDRGSGRIEKFYTMYELFHSLVSVFLLFGVVYLVWAVGFGVAGGPVARASVAVGADRASVGYLVGGIGLLWAARVSYHISAYYRRNHALVLITEFYTDVLLEHRQSAPE